jgi:hypothetical protein
MIMGTDLLIVGAILLLLAIIAGLLWMTDD